MFDDDDAGEYKAGGDAGETNHQPGGGEEEEFKGGEQPDFDKIPLDKQFIPSIYEDDNFDFKVVKPQLHGSHIVYHV